MRPLRNKNTADEVVGRVFNVKERDLMRKIRCSAEQLLDEDYQTRYRANSITH